MRFTLLCSLALFGILSNGSIFARDNYCQYKHQDQGVFDNILAHPTGSLAEWLPPKEILMHTPEEELFFGVIHPASALFERVFTASAAVKEHKQFIRLLEQNGAKVHTLKETILAGTIDANGEAVPGKDLDDLRNFASQFLTIDISKIPSEEQKMQMDRVRENIKMLSPKDLLKIILLRPTVHLQPVEGNTGLVATYQVAPLMNLYFLRDQVITTKKGIVIGKLNSTQREAETQVVKFALRKLKIHPIYEVTGNGFLEGGDFFMAGDVAFIGQGLRTNAAGIKQLLNNKVFGVSHVVVVKDARKKQDEMHLDTYFNIIGPKLAALIDTRMNDLDKTTVDVYALQGARYIKQNRNIPFKDYLKNNLKYKLIAVSKRDQEHYGINFLTVAPNKILAIRGSASKEYEAALREANVDITWVDFSNLTGGYGAAHCTTQPLVRNGSVSISMHKDKKEAKEKL